MVKDDSFSSTTTSLLSGPRPNARCKEMSSPAERGIGMGGKAQYKERQRKRGGRDGNGKDEVSPMGEACAGSLNPSNLLHFSFQGGIRKKGSERGGDSDGGRGG